MLEKATAQKDLLVSRGMSETLLDDLAATIVEFEQTLEPSRAGRREHVEASADLEAVSVDIAERVRMLDGLVRYRFGDNPALMDSDREEYGPRLLSLSAPCIWDGPAIRVEVATLCTPENPSGIYALKPAVAESLEWTQGEYCWVTGTVALSGRVVEHAFGYRAERAVIRELRLGVGTHLAVRTLETLGELMASLEERYQAPVDEGLAEREVADRLLTDGFKPRCPELPSVSPTSPWRVV